MVVSARGETVKELQRQIQEISDRTGNLKPALEEAADELLVMQRSYLKNPGWVPLSPEYAARKARQGFGTRTGVRTGDMFDSLTKKTDGLHLERIKPDSLYFGSKDPVANLFHKGTYRQTDNGKANRQPKRKLIRLVVKDRKRLLAIIRDHMLKPVD
jgi:hypothetical protein